MTVIMPHIGSQITVVKYIFESDYPGLDVTSNKDVSLEIKSRITINNRCCYGLRRQLKSRDLFRSMKLLLYNSFPILLNGKEVWTLIKNRCSGPRSLLEENSNIDPWFSSSDDFCVRIKHAHYELLKDMGILQRIKFQGLLWLENIVWMDEADPEKWRYQRELAKITTLYALDGPRTRGTFIFACYQLEEERE